jgi:exonuclease III
MKYIVLCLFFPFIIKASFGGDINIMFYNLHNLFDTVHDEGKNDWQYLPLKHPKKQEQCNLISGRYKKYCLETDWTPAKLDMKLEQIKKVVLSNGKLPDILAVCEIENQNVAKMLAKKLGYQYFVMTNSPDKRGIDVAAFFNQTKNLKINRYFEHEVKKGKMFDQKPTRNILEVQFKLRQQDLALFVNHWPSQSNPSEKRVIAAKQLKKLARKRINKGFSVVATGDFNVIKEDFPHAFNRILYSGGFWDKSRPTFADLHSTVRSSKKVPSSVKNALPLGTYFYKPKMSWNLLDRFFVSQNLLSENSILQVELDTYKIINNSEFTEDFTYTWGALKGTQIIGTPLRSNYVANTPEEAGFSDHFAISVNISH